MEIISWIVMGLVTGSMARVAMPGPAAGGMFVAILIGLLGAFTGGILGTTFSADTLARFNLYALGMAADCAMILLFLYRCIAMRFEVSQPMAESIPIRSNTPDLMATSADRIKV